VLIGTIVKSNSHISYMCRVYGKLETERVPDPRQYAFGTFVTLAPIDGSDVRLVGVVRDTLLLNPEYGNLGPRLSSDRELAVFSPDYLNERVSWSTCWCLDGAKESGLGMPSHHSRLRSAPWWRPCRRLR
jgi:hypothetical protein